MNTYTEQDRENDQALEIMGTWGSGDTIEKWEGFAFACTSYAPEWMELESKTGVSPDHDCCTTVIATGWSTPTVEGWELVGSYAAGEHECPSCSATGLAYDHETNEINTNGIQCQMCEGEKYIYWGCDQGVYVFAEVPIAEFDRDDICAAWHKWLSENHGGQGTPEYARLSKLQSHFDPCDWLSDNAQIIYSQIGCES